MDAIKNEIEQIAIGTRFKDANQARWYEIDGKQYIGVTSVLDNWVPVQLKNWFIKNSAAAIEKKKTDTAGQGTAIHESAAKGTEERLNLLLKEMEMVPISTEFSVKSKHGWAGTVDMLAKWKGRNYIVDIKTGRFSGLAGAQLGAYSLAANEIGLDVSGIGIISLPRDETKKAMYFDYTDYPDTPTMEDHQYGWCNLYDFWKKDNYKALQGWEFNKGKVTLFYNWSFNHENQN